MVCQTKPEINLPEAIGVHEFTVVLRALFAADRTMLHCLHKSTLMTLGEKDRELPSVLNLLSISVSQKHGNCDELHLVSDRYDIPAALKAATRVWQQHGQEPVSYHITKIPMKQLLYHTKTKMEMAEYFPRKVLERSEQEGRNVVVAWSNQCNTTHRDISRLNSCQEEPDTNMILHSMDATMHGATGNQYPAYINYCIHTQSFVKR